jgi:hypothetical protein
MKTLSFTLSLVLFFMLTMTRYVHAEVFDPSWSLNFAIEPLSTHLAGESVVKLSAKISDVELSHIESINCQNGSLNLQQCQQIESSGGQLEMFVDANQDGEYERLSIAVGKTKTGEYAKLLLIQQATTGQVLQILLVESAIAGFSALYFHQGEIMWGMCLSCDVLADVVWEQGKYQVRWQQNLSDQWQDEVIVDNR